jgi:MFS family permease
VQFFSSARRQIGLSFHGWRIVGLMLGPRAAGTGVYIMGGTLFLIPLEESLGLNRSVASLLFAAGTLVSGATAIVSGALMDRLGPRKILIVSVLISAAGYLLFALSSNVALVFIFYVGLISPAILNVAYNASTAFVNNWFDRQKATAMSLLQVGSGVGAMILIPALAFSIDAWGWRYAAIVGAGAVLVLGLPTALLSRDHPEEMGLLPDGVAPDPVGSGPLQMTGPTAREALKTPTFWMLTATVAAFGAAQTGMQVHFVPIMVWRGFDEIEGALVLTVSAAASIPMVVIMGWLADRLGRLRVVAASSAVVLSGIMLLILTDPIWTIWVAALLIAPGYGMYPLLWALVGQAFGRRSFSTIRGAIMGAVIPTTVGLPLIAGVSFDLTDSYAPTLWSMAALWAVSATVPLVTKIKLTAGF